MLHFQIQICGFCLLLLLLLKQCATYGYDDQSFLAFKEKYNKKYGSAEEEKVRFKIFSKNVKLIKKHNWQYDKGLESYSLALNEYADWEPKEFQRHMNGNFEHDFFTFRQRRVAILQAAESLELPPHVDWRQLGAVTPVKKQRRCGSCWAFAATGALEAQHFKKTGKLVALSEQNLLDCTSDYENLGCDGGSKEQAFLYVRDNGGIETELAYPYVAQQHDRCQFNASGVGAHCDGFVSIALADEGSLTAAVALEGPVAVALNGKCLKWQFYKQGIFNDASCDNVHLTHAVLIVGYGRNASTQEPYWIVKNSWGADWGMQGYVLVPRFVNFAGIAKRASIPLV